MPIRPPIVAPAAPVATVAEQPAPLHAPPAGPLPGPLRGLLRPEAYPHPVSAVRLVETHMSWVLLTGEHAYKIKRPVRFPFADFTDPAHRARLCHEEVRLNRRFAPQLYLGTVPIRLDGGAATLLGDGPVIEMAVEMRQFDRRDELDSLVLAGAVDAAEFARFGESLAAIHEVLPGPPAGSGRGNPAAIARVMRRNFAEWRAMQPPAARGGEFVRLRQSLAARLRRCRDALAVRAAAGCIRECHGDLHLSNLVRLEGRITPFDALEFEPAFRFIDVADEVAFLCADLEGYARPDLAHAFLDGYLYRAGDYGLLRVLDLYVAHRALVRAKIMAIRAAGAPAADDPTRWRRREADYAAVARRALSRPPPRLLLLYGLSGSGKSWLARRLAPQLGAIHLRSDRERKRLAGLAPTASSGSAPGTVLYAPDATEATYARLASCARDALAGGRSVICDATFLDRDRRRAFVAAAAVDGATPVLLHCEAPESVLRERLRARRAAADDVSEADESVLAWQLARAQQPDAGEGLEIHRIDTTAPDPVGCALRALRATPGTATG